MTLNDFFFEGSRPDAIDRAVAITNTPQSLIPFCNWHGLEII